MNAAVTSTVTKTRETLVNALPAVKVPSVKVPSVKVPSIDLTEARKPLFAAVGVADLAVEQVKDVDTGALQARLVTVPLTLSTLPTRTVAQALELRTDLEARAKKVSDKATAVYAELAVRGERLVTSIRSQPATEAAIAEGKEAVKKATQASTAAKKAVKAGEKAVEGAASKIG